MVRSAPCCCARRRYPPRRNSAWRDFPGSKAIFAQAQRVLPDPKFAGHHRDARQRAMPDGWAPLKWLSIRDLPRRGRVALARDVAPRWIHRNPEFFSDQRKLVEKDDLTGEAETGSGEYPLQDGFGWTNGVPCAAVALPGRSRPGAVASQRGAT
ncbi:trehalase family glycosidase [Luteimonas sp. SDU82]|uniref:trehalase family glycosidase n=1 Tax=Luteimonas sp. SDU82 TaxID=3422592 RepID=UPI003EBE68A7